MNNSMIIKVVTTDIDDLKAGDTAYVSPTRQPKSGDIVLCGQSEASSSLVMYNGQVDVLGTVDGSYRKVAH